MADTRKTALWFRFQDEARDLLARRHTDLLALLPAEVASQWDDGLISLIEVLCEASEAAFELRGLGEPRDRGSPSNNGA